MGGSHSFYYLGFRWHGNGCINWCGRGFLCLDGTAVLSSALLGFLVTGLGIVGMSAYCLIIIIDFFVILVGKFKDAEGKFVTK